MGYEKNLNGYALGSSTRTHLLCSSNFSHPKVTFFLEAFVTLDCCLRINLPSDEEAILAQ